MSFRCLCVIFFLFSSIARGDGPTDTSGINRLGETVTFYYDYGYHGEKKGHKITVSKAGSRDEIEKYELDEECPVWNDEEIQCDKNGKSPLAGATFRKIPNPDKDDCSYDVSYKCILGCDGKRVPLEMFKDFWECNEPICNKQLKRYGLINASDVMLRAAPKVASRVVAILPKGQKVNLERYSGNCQTLQVGWSRIEGDWIYVQFVKSGKIVSGWVFDSLIIQNDHP
jgi:hypothetical protein